MDISFLARRADIQNPSVVKKAQQLSQEVEITCHGGLGEGDISRNAICLELACRMLNEFVPRNLLIRYSGVSEKVYKSNCVALQNILKLQFPLDMKDIALRFGCTRLLPFVQSTLESYEKRMSSTISSARRTQTKFHTPPYFAAAFWLCSKKRKIKVKREDILQAFNVSLSEFSRCSASMLDVCYDTIGIAKTNPKRVSRGEKPALPEDNKEPTENDCDILGTIETSEDQNTDLIQTRQSLGHMNTIYNSGKRSRELTSLSRSAKRKRAFSTQLNSPKHKESKSVLERLTPSHKQKSVDSRITLSEMIPPSISQNVDSLNELGFSESMSSEQQESVSDVKLSKSTKVRNIGYNLSEVSYTQWRHNLKKKLKIWQK